MYSFLPGSADAPHTIKATSLKLFVMRLVWLSVLPFLVLAAYFVISNYNDLNSRLKKMATDRARNVIGRIDGQIHAQIDGLEILAASASLRGPSLDEFYAEAQAYYGSIGTHVLLIDPSMQILIHTREPLGTALPQAPVPNGKSAARRVLETLQPAVGDVFMGPIAQEPLVAIAVPVIQNVEIKYILVTLVDMGYLKKQLDSISFPSEWSITLLDGAGNNMAQRLPVLKEPILPDDTIERFVSPSSISNWSISIEIPRSVYLAPIVSATGALAIIILVAGIISALLAGFGTKRLGDAVAGLAGDTLGPVSNLYITEIENVRRSLKKAVEARNKAYKALSESSRRLRVAKSAALLGIFDYDIALGKIHWDQRLRDLWGIEQNVPITYEVFESGLHPDDIDSVRAAIDKSFGPSGNGHYEAEYRVINRKDKIERWIYAVGKVFFDQNRPAHIIGTVQDITERKHLVDAVQRNEAMLRTVVEQMPSGVTVRDAVSGNLILSNERSRKIMGKLATTLDDFIQYCGYRSDGSSRLPEDWPASRSITAGEVVDSEEVECRRDDGTPIVLSISSSPVRDSSGKIIMGVSVFHDITDRKKAESEIKTLNESLECKIRERTARLQSEIEERKKVEQALIHSNAKYRALYEESTDGVILLNKEGEILDANRAALELFGYSMDEFCGKQIKDLMDPDDLVLKPYRFQEILMGGTVRLDRRMRNKDGSLIILELTGKLISQNLVQSIYHDITDRVHMEEILEKKASELSHINADLIRSNKDLEHFAYVASHDLQEPLRTVATSLQIFAKMHAGKYDQETDELIEFAVQTCKRMKSLIEDLLTYARISAHEPSLGQVDMGALLKKTIQDLQFLLDKKGAEINSDKLPTVIGDAGQLGQVFQNLISNSVKFIGEQKPRIHISAIMKGKEWIFSVRDNGIGIDEQFFDRIFVIFQQLNKRGSFNGTGIGLSIVKKIVERHRGRVWVESELGKGSTFFFSIPKEPE